MIHGGMKHGTVMHCILGAKTVDFGGSGQKGEKGPVVPVALAREGFLIF